MTTGGALCGLLCIMDTSLDLLGMWALPSRVGSWGLFCVLLTPPSWGDTRTSQGLTLAFLLLSGAGSYCMARVLDCSHSFVLRATTNMRALNFFFKFLIVIQLQLSAFSPHPSTPPQSNPSPSPTSTLPLDFVHVSFRVVPVIPSPHCPLPTPPCPLLDCS